MPTMPPEWAQHERTLIAWPCRTSLWGAALGEARRETAALANAIADFEPVLMVARPEDADEARAALAAAVDVWPAVIDDSWLRDSGPIFAGGQGVQFGFNAWGGKYPPWDDDATIAGRLCDHLGVPWARSELVLEGGAIAVDGTGTLLTTEECLLNPNRNPGWSRERIEAELRARLGAERVVWLEHGLVEDRDTDGHVDLVAAFAAPGRALLVAVGDDNPNAPRLAAARARLQDAGIEVLDLPGLRYAEVAGERVAVSPANLYVANGAVFVAAGGEGAAEAVRAAFPGREVIPVPADTLAFGGGGPHCVTQQVPSGAGRDWTPAAGAPMRPAT
jgi:agmatine deiminase